MSLRQYEPPQSFTCTMMPSVVSRLERSTLRVAMTRRNDTDAAACEAFAEFERQAEEWSMSTGAAGASQRVREDFAANLSTK